MPLAVAAPAPSDDYPTYTCPRCDRVRVDMDGFGLLACPDCGYCTHTSSSSDASGNMVCDLCGQVVGKVTRPKGFTDGAGI